MNEWEVELYSIEALMWSFNRVFWRSFVWMRGYREWVFFGVKWWNEWFGILMNPEFDEWWMNEVKTMKMWIYRVWINV